MQGIVEIISAGSISYKDEASTGCGDSFGAGNSYHPHLLQGGDKAMKDIYHIKHSCGHSVYWDNPAMGLATKHFPCIYCGGEAGNPHPSGAVVHDINDLGHVRQDPSQGCHCEKEGTAVRAHHMKDESCCS